MFSWCLKIIHIYKVSNKVTNMICDFHSLCHVLSWTQKGKSQWAYPIPFYMCVSHCQYSGETIIIRCKPLFPPCKLYQTGLRLLACFCQCQLTRVLSVFHLVNKMCHPWRNVTENWNLDSLIWPNLSFCLCLIFFSWAAKMTLGARWMTDNMVK